MDNVLIDAGQKIISEIYSLDTVRNIERTQYTDESWQTFLQSGFLDILCTEEQGGAGHELRHIHSLIHTAGQQAIPVALASSIWIRAILIHLGHPVVPDTEISLALGQIDQGKVRTDLCFARTAEWVLLSLESQAYLLPKATMQQVGDFIYGTTTGRFEIEQGRLADFAIQEGYNWQAIGACIFATLIAGAASKVQDICHVYAGERKQFGKHIGSFQAIQHQLAILAEEVMAVNYAAEMALNQQRLQPGFRLAAIAKARCSQAVVQICSIGHLIHGAIGVTEEYNLQLYTRRLHEWRMQFGSESFWYQHIAQDFMQKEQGILDFVMDTFGS